MAFPRFRPRVCLAACLLVAASAVADDFDAWMLRGREAMRQRDYAAAIAAYENATRAAPQRADGWFRLGLARSGADDIDGALAAYEKAVEIEPGHARALNNIANAHFRRGDYERALDWYGRALAVDPDYLLALFHRGWVLRHFARHDEAEADFRRCLELPAESDRDRATRFDCLYYFGALRFRAEDYATTAQVMEQVVGLRPSHVEARYYLGMAYRELGRIDEAREQLEVHRRLVRAARRDEPVQKADP